MKIFDFNIHLPEIVDKTDDKIKDEIFLTPDILLKNYNSYKSEFKNLIGANFMVLNDSFFKKEGAGKVFSHIKKDYDSFFLSALVDFRDDFVFDYLEILKNFGVRGIKFHSYIQKIAKEDFKKVLDVAKRAEELGFFIAIDTSFGTLGIYDYDNLKLAAFIAKSVKKAPVVLLHSGGLRTTEAMLIAEDAKNIFLETSFSLIYYKDAPFLDNFAFVFKKLGSKKVLYGSDFPYVGFDESFDFTFNFLEKNGFSNGDLEDIFFKNALGLL